MIDIFNIEKQALKRVRNFIHDLSEKEKIQVTDIKLVINCLENKPGVHLINQNLYLKSLDLKAVVEYFGQEYKLSQSEALKNYIEELAEARKTNISGLNVVICENKGTVGVYLYEGYRFVKQIPALEILTHFYFS